MGAMPAFERETLPNNLRVLTAPMPHLQSVICFVMLRDYVSGVYDELVCGGHPLGWDIIGRKETVRAAERETFLDYLGHWYKPSRMVVGVGGRLGENLLERIGALLGELEDGPTV